MRILILWTFFWPTRNFR